MTTPNDLRAWYDDLALTLPPGEYASRVMYAYPHQRDRLERLLAILQECGLTGPDSDCLEVGCNEGAMTVRLAPLFGIVEAIDISSVMIDRAPKLDNVMYEAIPVELWLWRAPPQDNRTVAVLSEVLEHLRGPVGVLKGLARRFRYILVSCPINEQPNPRAFDLELLGHETDIGDASGHIHTPDMAMLRGWFEQAELEIVHQEIHGVTGIILAKRKG
jgi:SAM-dependent methyltransferase